MLKRFISYYKPFKVLFFYDMLASFLISLIGIIYPILTRKVFNEYVSSSNVKMIIIMGILLLVLYIIRFFLKFFVQYQGHVMGVKMQANMRKDMFAHLQDLPFNFYDENETGRIMSRMTNDLQEVSELAHHGPENIFICGVMLIGSFIYLFIVNWVMALILLICVPIMLTISLFMKNKMRDAFAENKKNIASINAQMESSISGIRVTKAFTNKKKEIEKFEANNQAYVDSRKKAYFAMASFHSSTAFILDLFNVVCILAGGLLAIYEKINLPDYMAFVVSISLFTSPLTTLVNFVEQYQDGVAGFKRFIEVIDKDKEKDTGKDIAIQGEIAFKNVSFDYETKSDILNDVSFNIKKGEVIALVGESGGGKTTICHLIPHFYDVTSGTIYIDDYPLNDISLTSLRKAIGIVQQDVFLFNGSIKENILYGKLDASFDEVIEASKKANIYDYIMTLPNGFDTQIGERGIKLSGGQKQRLSIARVFLKDPTILILDEATSSLDNTTEMQIQEALANLAKGRTTIIVAHRLSTIKNASKIFVIEKGKILEQGTHDELLAKNGIYKNLYQLQFNR